MRAIWNGSHLSEIKCEMDDASGDVLDVLKEEMFLVQVFNSLVCHGEPN